jgi:Xaa-Pro aminopeptidase
LENSPRSAKKDDPSYLPSWRFTGHSIGLRIHEPPSWIAEEERKLVPGMVLTLEVAGYDIPE